MTEIKKEQIRKLMCEYYKSIPRGRALAELRFCLQKELEKINFALYFESREEMIKRKAEIETRLNYFEQLSLIRK